MTAEIDILLTNLEIQHGIEILHACESGSRAWGFASPDSDYDIRFLYRRPVKKSYLVTDAADTIEVPIENDLDPGGWELRKALGLLAKSNGALIEWLNSPIVYRANEEFLEEMRRLATEHLSRRQLANHYRGMAHKVMGTGLKQKAPTGKAYLYALRALLSAQWVLDYGTPPPVAFVELLGLLPDEVAGAVDRLLVWKESGGEKESPGRISEIDCYLDERLETLSGICDGMPDEAPSKEPFNEALHRWTLWPDSLQALRMQKGDFTLERVREKDLLLFEAVSGSRSFGTHHAGSDTDLRGVFVAPESFLTGLETIEQVSDEKSDEVYYEVGRFVSLLLANNPNIVELLFTPGECVRHRRPAFDLIKPEDFLSKLCRQSFGNYAMGQIRKARGLKKKIVNPEPEVRRHLREFCHVLKEQGSISLADWMVGAGLCEDDCALVAVQHAPGIYAIFHYPEGRGIFTKKDDAAVLCSSVPKEAKPVAWMNCNFDAFKAHCRAHREYWKWVGERNEDRYETNTSHGRGYDSKNLMHTLRLLEQATEIAKEGRIILPRPNADWLKSVKAGGYEYEDLLTIAEEKNVEMEEAFEASSLMDQPSREVAEEVLLAVRAQFRS
ncbi:nucleotidyltransferase domain-containing protein [Verrucomicrobiaceae bacterium 227]